MEVDLYFHGNVDRETAECRLMLFSSNDGTYLIRSKDEENYVISVYYMRKIAHYLITEQSDGRIVWGSDHIYDTLESLVLEHSQQTNGMVTLLTHGCPVRYFILHDSLFPGHQCTGLCWFHGKLPKEEVSLRLAVTDPICGSFLVTTSTKESVIHVLSIWLNSRVKQFEVIEMDDKIGISLQHKFDNLLELIKFYKEDKSLGVSLRKPCCVSTWLQRGQLSHPPELIPDNFRQSDVEVDGTEDPMRPAKRKVAMKTKKKSSSLNLSNLSNLSLSDNESYTNETEVGYFNMTFSDDEDTVATNNRAKDENITLELHNTLSRRGSNNIKRKSLEKSQRKLMKMQAAARKSSSSDEMDGGSSEQVQPKLKRRNAGERKKNKKHFLRQSEIESLKSSSDRLSLDKNSILCSDIAGNGTCSKVYQGTLHYIPVAVKRINKGSSKWRHVPLVVEHDNITRLIGFEKQQIIVTELCEIGSLDIYLSEKGKKDTSPLNVLFWLRDVCSALLYIEDMKLPLRALSCRNILLNSALCAKLSIYSTTRFLSDQDTDKIRWYPTDSKTSLTWSFGITLIEAVHYSQFSYKDLLDIKYNNGIPIVSFQPHVPIAVRNLIKLCIRQRPSDRPTLTTVKEKLSVILDLIVKAYNWKVKDQSSIIRILSLDESNTNQT